MQITIGFNNIDRSFKDLMAESKGLGYTVGSILSSPEANPKLIKNLKKGVMSFPLHLLPDNEAGFGSVCPKSSVECRKFCLNRAGNPAYLKGKLKARYERTKMFFKHKELYFTRLIKEIKRAKAKADKAGMQCGIRLNATSDLSYEKFYIKREGFAHGSNLMDWFPDVEFYDYTAVDKRTTPSNYHLTFSLKEDNFDTAMAEHKRGLNIAIPFKTKRQEDIPNTWKGIKVIDGDEHDFRPLDKPNTIVGLTVKGNMDMNSPFFQEVTA